MSSISGINFVLSAILETETRIGTGVSRGLKKAGVALQKRSQGMVPVEFSVLKDSAFTRAEGKGLNTVVKVGYTALYGVYVHEYVQMKLKGKPRKQQRGKLPPRGKYWDPQPQASAKFLERPARMMMPEMEAIIAASVMKELVLPFPITVTGQIRS
jgi:hypothetical protein